MTLPDHADSPSRLPWKRRPEPAPPANASAAFTAVIYAQQQSGGPLGPSAASSAPLVHLLRVVARSRHVARVTQ